MRLSKALNALNGRLMHELLGHLEAWDRAPEVRAMVVTGSAKAFAAGADIKEMLAVEDFAAAYEAQMLEAWDRVAAVRKPVVAAVNGYALGGGCELAMMCDFILAGDSAAFGQPEITLGTIPGMGGTQRLARAVGKATAMDLCLTGRRMGAEEAERKGLVSRVVPAAALVEEAVNVAETIAGFSVPVAALCKEAVNVAQEAPLAEGLRLEKRLFWASFALRDRAEGMRAFAEKRAPRFEDR